MKYYYPILLCFAFLFHSVLVSGQKTKDIVTADFKSATIDQFVQELETQTGFHFYYDVSQFDSLRIMLSVTEQPLSKVLELAFAGTDFFYSIDEKNRVFFSRGQPVRTALPEGLLGKANVQKKTLIECY